ncbi:hypothetical protein [Herbaspirillum rubrisubalbicans]|uniref:hypothetical protein n=1 Tax=Herbaspirillum rubrisubalbicans TaxID=80842 RepID=UPI000AE8DBB9|nr:hypothetical protein [Herbaspirillum rubrisubalbicans]
MKRHKIRPSRKASAYVNQILYRWASRLAREEYLAQRSPEEMQRAEAYVAQEVERERRIREKAAKRPTRIRAEQHLIAWRNRTQAAPVDPGFFNDWWI